MSNVINQGKFATTIPFPLNKIKEVNGEKKSVEIGKADLPIPLLADFGITAELAMENGKPVTDPDDGTPMYADDAFNWLQNAIINGVKAQSRNKYIDGQLKAGAKLAETFAELTSVSERDGAAIKAKHDCKKAFIVYLQSKNLKPQVVKILADLFGDANSIAYARENFVKALQAHMAPFVSTFNEVDKTRFANTIERVMNALEGDSVDLMGNEVNDAA